jgi:hypothetical protein
MSDAIPELARPPAEMVPFPPIEELPALPPAPGEQPIPQGRLRAAFLGQAAGAVGALMLLASLFIGGWYHVDRIDVILGDRQIDDSYIGKQLTLATNYYSLSVWAFLKRGYAIPALIVALGAAVAGLIIIGRRRRTIMALSALFAIAAALCIVLDLRRLPATVLETARNSSVGFPTGIHPRGIRPGPMMFLAFGGLALQGGGALLAFICLPRVRRVRRALRPKRQPECEEQAIDQFQSGGTGEYAIQGASTLPVQAADQGHHEGQGDQREQYPS